ncbi:hypothetical protein OG800_01875 [Streptomyces sp. NBC_00445]
MEYGEIVEGASDLLKEPERGTTRCNATYAEVEESEVDLERFDKWLAKIVARDYFHAPGGAAAREAVEQCRTALAAFEDTAIVAQAGAHPVTKTDRSTPPASAKLRAASETEHHMWWDMAIGIGAGLLADELVVEGEDLRPVGVANVAGGVCAALIAARIWYRPGVTPAAAAARRSRTSRWPSAIRSRPQRLSVSRVCSHIGSIFGSL